MKLRQMHNDDEERRSCGIMVACLLNFCLLHWYSNGQMSFVRSVYVIALSRVVDNILREWEIYCVLLSVS